MDLYDLFIQKHQPQLESSGVPPLFWPRLFQKLNQQIFDAGAVFTIAKIDYNESIKNPEDPGYKLFVSATNGLTCINPNNIFLIDHAWTYDVVCAKRHLTEVPGLLDRLCNLMCYDNNINSDVNQKIDFILEEMWRYNQSFALNIGTVEERMPLWYIMDELGSAINHSDKPTFRTVPFLHLNENLTYTLLFPIKDNKFNDEVTRDFIENQTNNLDKRNALLLPWREYDFTKESFDQSETNENDFLVDLDVESLPINTNLMVQQSSINSTAKLKVFTQYDVIIDYLTDNSFEIVNDDKQADILWLTYHYKDYKLLNDKSPHVFINQFPYENVLTIKNLLAIVCRRKAVGNTHNSETLETYPSWLPTTYNLNTELIPFISYFQNRQAQGLDNHWICKPWNLARGLDTYVTKNLFQILRLPCTGPKIAQKYISTPVLFTRSNIGKVKFDIRYVVLLKSIEPLIVHAYTNFFLRFANKPFALDNLNDYEQHFTVMNYTKESPLYHLKCANFINDWNKMYPNYEWKTIVEDKIFKMIRQVFEAACVEPPRGLAANPQSRALYAIDLMLEWKNNDIEPVLLEVNFMPDNKRACEYYPNFYNDVFKFLFLNIENPELFVDLIY